MIPAFPFLRTAPDTRFDLWAWIKSGFPPATVVGPIEDPEATARKWNLPVETFTTNPEATQVYRDRRQLFDDVYTALVPLFPRLHA